MGLRAGLLLLIGCNTATVAEQDTAAEEVVPPMDALDVLTRASLDLRGVRPTVDELQAVTEDPAVLDDLLEDFLYDERFGERVRSLFSEIYLTRQDSWPITAWDYGLDSEPEFAAAVGEEPLRILSTIAEEDLPYSTIVTADWTMVNEHLAGAWSVDYPAGETGWQKAAYTDGRPMAGILSTNGMWWRYTSNTSNANRGRANAVSRILLCQNYLERGITFDRNVDLLDSDALLDALQTNPGCVACHYSLDPMAGYFWGFFYYTDQSPIDMAVYHPERELLWEDTTGLSPAFYGEAGSSLSDLSLQLASDSRLASCVTEQVFGGLLQRDVTLEDTASLTQHRQAFIEGGTTLRALYRSVISSPEYRAGPTSNERYVPWKLISSDIFASSVEDLTGYRFTYEGYDMLQTDTYGLRSLAGGVDGNFVTRRASSPIPTMALVVERVSEAASWNITRTEQREDDDVLYTLIDFTETPDTNEDLMRQQLQQLHLRLLSNEVALDGEEIEANLALWSELYSQDNSTIDAWAGVLSVLIRDPDFLIY